MKKYLLLLLTLVFAMTSYADKVTEQQALQKAQRFFKDKQIVTSSLTRSITRSNHSTSPEDFYVFNAEDNGGFVIISGDDRTPDVLGYADSGKLDLNNLPPNLKGWLEDYSKQIKVLDTFGITQRENTSRAATRATKAPVEPLITTKWGQGHPYNNQCPVIDGTHCVTGCVATAMAQVMYYHKWPQQPCSEIPAYTTATRQIQMNALPPTTFKWDKMRDYYWESEHGENADAVAELMRYCGQAVEMNYDVGGSGAFEMPSHLIKYFGYSKNSKFVRMSQYTTTQWEDILYKELSEGRPMLYGGANLYSAHEFICDGYDGNGFYHFNWGDNGDANGFFLLSVLCDMVYGSYVIEQTAIIGIKPENGENTKPYVYSYDGGDLTKTDYSRSSNSVDFSDISMTQGIYIQYEIAEEQDVSIDYGVGLFKGTRLYTVLNHSTAVLNLANNTIFTQANVAFGRELEDGVYQIRTIYKLADQENWETCTDAYINYIAATITGNHLELRKVNHSEIDNANYVVNSVSYSSKLCLWRNLEVTVNLTNIGDTNQELLYVVYEKDGSKCHGALACGSVAPGETGDVVFPILFGGQSMEATIRIAADRDCKRIMWEDCIKIEEPEDHNLSCSSFTVDNLDNGILKDSKYHITMNLTNSGDNVYDDLIVCEYHHLVSSKGGILLGRRYQHVLLNPGESKQIEFIIPVEGGNTYQVYLSYYGKDVKFWANIPIDPFFVVTNSTAYDGINYAFFPNSKEASVLPGDYQNIKSVSIPAFITINGISYNVTAIEQGAFKGYNFQTITLPDGLLSIGSDAFMQCIFQSINLPEGLISIGSGAFMKCNISSITLPSTIRKIDNLAFSSTYGLKEIAIPEGVLSIGYAAFRECMDLEFIKLPSTLESLGDDVVFNCSKLKYIYSAMTEPITIPEDAFLYMDFSGETPKRIPCPATLLVPEGSVEKYKAAPVWKEFKNIQAFDPTGIKEILMTDGEVHDIYDLQGRKVKAKTTSLDGLPRGVYIINGKKVILK